jgi:hypothetical protein
MPRAGARNNRRIQAFALRPARRRAEISGGIHGRAAAGRAQDALQGIGAPSRQHARVELPSAARAAAGGFALVQLLDLLGEPRHPPDPAQHVGELARREHAALEGVEHEVERRLGVVGAAHARHFQRERPVGALGHDRLHAQAHGGRAAAVGTPQDVLHRRLRLLGEQLLHGDRLLVAGAERPAGRITALSGLEFHRDNSFGYWRGRLFGLLWRGVRAATVHRTRSLAPFFSQGFQRVRSFPGRDLLQCRRLWRLYFR